MDVGELAAQGAYFQHLLDELVPSDIQDGLHRGMLGAQGDLGVILPRLCGQSERQLTMHPLLA